MERDDIKRQPAGSDPRADATRAWRRISEQLVALIGESGFCALFARAKRMLTARYDWLSAEPARGSIDALLAALEQDLGSVDGTVAAIANKELLDTFTRQLSTLIGEALTARLLVEATASMPPGPDEAQEHK